MVTTGPEALGTASGAAASGVRAALRLGWAGGGGTVLLAVPWAVGYQLKPRVIYVPGSWVSWSQGSVQGGRR